MVEWTRSLVRDRLLARLTTPAVRDAVRAAETAVREDRMTPDQAASEILAALDAHS
jgi:LAO/AO transport system kinase